MSPESSLSNTSFSRFGLYAGPVIALLVLLIGPPATLDVTGSGWSPAWVTLAALILMAIWWITEAVPIPVTSLLPLVIFPLTGVSSMAQASAPYMHPIVVLLMGGFIFAKAIERWDLHERIALNVVAKAGNRPATLIGGFMLAAALLSMWISNTATSIMMMPIALSVAASVQAGEDGPGPFTFALLLGIAYACSIGGLGTPIGTPTNLIILRYLNDATGTEIGFAQWMLLGLPMVALMLPLAWFVLTRWAFKVPATGVGNAQQQVSTRLAALGRMRTPEWRTLAVFGFIASLWVFRRPINAIELGWSGGSITPFAGLTDHVVAIIAVVLCFVVPAGGKRHGNERLLDWGTAERIPWGVVLLFGGGMSLAQAISSTGLSTFIGQGLASWATLPTPVLIILITAAVLALTEVTSNVATASALMPVLGALALETGLPLELMAAPLALAASCAFMLPMATGPNAVVFATGQIRLATMARAGLRLNLIAVFLITLVAWFVAPIALGQ
ncbi:MAG: DASS family sodium-coupled anion symporter [Gammaproteobacteria bacterium]